LVGSINGGAKATTGAEAGGRRSETNLLGNIQGVVHLNSEISDGAFQLGLSEELDYTQVAGLPINLGSLGHPFTDLPLLQA
jgi:hypothetical protein